MTPAELVARLGSRLYHVTAERNGASIARHGLMTPETLARRARIDPGDLILRRDRREIDLGDGAAILNHQLPLRAGRGSARDWLDGMTVEAWSAQLDRRVFFWAGRTNARFGRSVEQDGHRIAVWSLSTAKLIAARGGDLWLSPINSGSATRRPSRRGSWLYVSASEPWETFAMNRVRRGLVRSPDTVLEVSLTGGIEPHVLAALDWREERAA